MECSETSASSTPDGWVTPRTLKDVAMCTTTKDSVDGLHDTLRVKVVNGYPSYWCTAWFHVRNYGSVPLKLQRVTLLGVNPGMADGEQDLDISPSEYWCIDTDGLTDAFGPMDPEVPCPEMDMDDGGPFTQSPEDYDLKVHLSELELGDQIDPTGSYGPDRGDGANVQGNIDIHVEQGAQQDDMLEFELEMQWVQWNEYEERGD